MPEDNLANSTSSETGDSKSQSELDILSDDVVESGSETEETSETEEDEETEEPEQDKVSDEDEVEEVDEEESKITRPSWKEIKDKYPELAKNSDFKEVFHRERAYSEIFPTVEEARISADKAISFDNVVNELEQGNVTYLTKAIADNPEQLTLFARNILPALQETNEEAFKVATAAFTSDLLHKAVEFAKSRGDENLEKSAYNLAKLLFGVKFGELPNRGFKAKDPEVEAEKDKFRQKSAELETRQKTDFLEKADKSIKVRLEKEILSGLSDLENEYTKKAILNDTLTEVKSLLANDSSFSEHMRRIIIQAQKGAYTPEHLTRVVSAYMNRAKTIAARSRAKFKSSALGKQSTKKVENTTKRVEGTGKENKEISLKGAEKRNFYRGKTDLDIINS